MYTPDRWQIIKVNGDDPHYKVFGTWSGGYTDPDSWRMNSGIVDVEEHDDYYDFIGHSGSVYRCRKGGYGTNTYGLTVLTSLIEQFDDGVIEAEPDKDWTKVDWLISAGS